MTLKKSEFIARYGEDAWRRALEYTREWRKKNQNKVTASMQKWRDENPDKVRAGNRERSHEGGRKGGKYYEEILEYKQTGLQGERNRIRNKHAKDYRPLKKIIAPESQIHHEWIPKTAKYNGLALVEAKPHQYGIIDVIYILDGKITLLTEEEIRNQELTIDIPHEEALALIQEIQTKKDNLGMEMTEWIEWGDDVEGRLCDMFDIPEEEVKSNA